MKRVFLATRPALIYRVVHEWYDSALKPFDEQPVVAYNEGTGCFEPVGETTDSTLFLVNDKREGDVLSGFTITEDDYLIYHEATRNDRICNHFTACNRCAASHEDDPAVSQYARVFDIIRDGRGKDEERVVTVVFPSKRYILSFLSRLNEETSPVLPVELKSLQEEYDLLLEAGLPSASNAGQWQTFVDHCLEIYQAL
ncbi:MAG: hypothetical protein IKM93_07220 [Bacteroidales bacterium]|nr:hypothetical protein [Bacteroidales bacterium]